MMINENKKDSNEDSSPSQPTEVVPTGIGTAANLITEADYDINISNNSAASCPDHCDMSGVEILNKCHLDLFPKKPVVKDEECCGGKYAAQIAQLPTLSGEYEQFVGMSGKSNNDLLILTNFRLFFVSHDGTSFLNVPLRLIESIEVKEINFIYVYLKIAKTIRLTFNSSERTLMWASRLNSILNYSPSKLDELFAFAFYSWYTNENNSMSSSSGGDGGGGGGDAVVSSSVEQSNINKHLFAKSKS